MNDSSVFDTLCELLNTSGARFRVLEHPAEGKSDAIAALRGTRPEQGAKAMLCTFKDGGDTTALAVIPGHLKIDFRKVADAVGRRKATLASPDVAAAVTRCVMGAVPPFVFDANVTLVVDPALVERNTEIAFNAGRLDRSVVLDAADYVRIARPLLVDITRPETTDTPAPPGPRMSTNRKPLPSEQASLIEQVQRIAEGLGEMFAPFTEVVVHDLRTPEHAILAIHNNLSGRAVGDPATELGLARIADDDFPQVLANYPNRFADGRTAKSTSIGIKDSTGRYVAALCLNADVTLFRGFQGMLNQFCRTDGETVVETLDPAGADAIRQRIDAFATRLATTPRELKTDQRRELMQTLKADGFLEVRRAMEIVSQHLGVSRATVYNDAK